MEEKLRDDLRRGFKLGPWKIYPNQGLLESPDRQTRVEPKVMEVLLCLASHPDEVIKRDDLIATVWAGTFVTDEVLSRAISLLRTELGDDRKTPTYIQTLPKLGYRLIMPVEELKPELPAPKASVTSASHLSSPAVIGSAVAVLVLIVLASLWLGGEKQVDPDSPAAFANLSDWFDFLVARSEGTEGVDDMTSIAVLPFDNLSEEQENAYFSDGLTDEITMTLSKVRGLKVVARGSSGHLKNRQRDIPTIGKLLNVDAILEGSVRSDGRELRITVQLSNARDGYLLWSETYEGRVTEAFVLQTDISREIVKSLQQEVWGTQLQVPAARTPPDIQAYQLYMNGRFLSKLRGEQALRQSIEKYRQALAIDPNFLRIQLGLANSMALLPFYSPESQEAMFEKVLALLDEYEFTDPVDIAEKEAILGLIAYHRWEFIQAEQYFQNSLRLDPNNPNTYNWYSQFLSMVGRNRDAVFAAERGRELDAVSPVMNDRLGVAYLWVDNDVRAAEQFAIGSQLGFSTRINPAYIVFLLRQGRYNEFKSIMEAIHHDPKTRPDWLIENGHLVFLREHRELAIDLATKAQKEGHLIAPVLQFGLWVLIGGVDQAFETFDRFKDDHKEWLFLEFLFSREAEEFRKDPRFNKLVQDIGLKAYWGLHGKPDVAW